MSSKIYFSRRELLWKYGYPTIGGLGLLMAINSIRKGKKCRAKL